MTSGPASTYTAFLDSRCVAAGSLNAVAAMLRSLAQEDARPMPIVFRDDSGEQVDFNLNEPESVVPDDQHAAADLKAASDDREKPVVKARGRPKLGVIAREVTLLPDHWDWLALQPGGASVALRKLVHEARKTGAGREDQRLAHDRAYRAMSALAGNLPGFEEASRALFAGKLATLAIEARAWPADVLAYVLRLAVPTGVSEQGQN